MYGRERWFQHLSWHGRGIETRAKDRGEDGKRAVVCSGSGEGGFDHVVGFQERELPLLSLPGCPRLLLVRVKWALTPVRSITIRVGQVGLLVLPNPTPVGEIIEGAKRYRELLYIDEFILKLSLQGREDAQGVEQAVQGADVGEAPEEVNMRRFEARIHRVSATGKEVGPTIGSPVCFCDIQMPCRLWVAVSDKNFCSENVLAQHW